MCSGTAGSSSRAAWDPVKPPSSNNSSSRAPSRPAYADSSLPVCISRACGLISPVCISRACGLVSSGMYLTRMRTHLSGMYLTRMRIRFTGLYPPCFRLIFPNIRVLVTLDWALNSKRKLEVGTGYKYLASGSPMDRFCPYYTVINPRDCSPCESVLCVFVL